MSLGFFEYNVLYCAINFNRRSGARGLFSYGLSVIRVGFLSGSSASGRKHDSRIKTINEIVRFVSVSPGKSELG